MALQESEQPSITDNKLRPELNLALFWDKPSEFPPLAWEQWRERFHTALLAKYDLDTEELQEFVPRPTLIYVPESAPVDQIETREAQKARLERNAEKQERAEAKLKEDIKEWNETKFGGLNHVSANRKAKSVLFMMLGEEGQRRYE